jgi:uncharacterized membrane protein YhaH (DUF805 family)
MSMITFYFSAKGRVSRREYWLRLLVPFFVLQLAAYAIDNAIGGVQVGPMADVDIVSEALTYALWWPSAVVTIKRLHDTNKSGWWYLALTGLLALCLMAFVIDRQNYGTYTLMFAGAASLLVMTYYNWFKRGDVGPNKYGLDPVYEAANATS